MTTQPLLFFGIFMISSSVARRIFSPKHPDERAQGIGDAIALFAIAWHVQQ